MTPHNFSYFIISIESDQILTIRVVLTGPKKSLFRPQKHWPPVSLALYLKHDAFTSIYKNLHKISVSREICSTLPLSPLLLQEIAAVGTTLIFTRHQRPCMSRRNEVSSNRWAIWIANSSTYLISIKCFGQGLRFISKTHLKIRHTHHTNRPHKA